MAVTVPQKNMLFYVCPQRSQSALWRRCCRRLLEHIEQFDGVRSLFVAQGEGLEPHSEVVAEFKGTRLDHVLTGDNHLELYEAAHWHRLLETVQHAPGITWFGHSKGITHGPDQWAIQMWVEAGFEITLTSPTEVERTLCDEHYLTTGPFMLREPGQKWGPWCYSGTFYWFHNRVFGRDWRTPLVDRWCVETWPARVSAIGEGKCMCCQDAGLLWKWQNWVKRRSKEVAAWRDLRPHHRRYEPRLLPDSKPSLDVITPCSRPANLSRIAYYLETRLPSFDVRWAVVCDTTRTPIPAAVPGCSFLGGVARQDQGSSQRNLGLESGHAGLVYFLDDDNIPHPALDAALLEAIREAPDAPGYVFGQCTAWGTPLREASPTAFRRAGVDMGQVVLRREAIGSARFPPSGVYENDWVFFDAAIGSKKDQLYYGPVATYYNALAPVGK